MLLDNDLPRLPEIEQIEKLSNVEQCELWPMEDIKREYLRLRPNGNWFSQGIMVFFKSRLAHRGYQFKDNVYFISSEKLLDNERGHTIRVMSLIDGDIDNISEFQQYESNSEATNALLDYINNLDL